MAIKIIDNIANTLKQTNTRLTMKEIFVNVVRIIALRSTCNRARVGALIVKDNRIISIGYNGSPPGESHCLDVGCYIDQKTNACIKTIHAEINAINWAIKNNINIEETDFYCTISPCEKCAKFLIKNKIKRFIYCENYKNGRYDHNLKTLEDNGIKIYKIKSLI